MGLCKCPKKRVTNLFCYEHRVNVCESCMVKHHSKCIVQSYLQWLQDSDYNPNCVLCIHKLSSDDCVRLICLHVFHWKCLERRCRRLPNTTAPAGYTCPICEEVIFPLPNVATPVADQLRERLSTVNWARHALGLPAVSEPEIAQIEDDYNPLLNKITNIESSRTNERNDNDNLVIYLDEQVYARPEETAKMPRRVLSTVTNSKLLVTDEDEKKDRKEAVSMVSLWMKFFGRKIRFYARERYGRCKLALIIIALISVVCVIFSILGRIVTEDDPAFDPVHNPHVHLKKPSA